MAFSDSKSEEYAISNLCGSFHYSIEEPVPNFVSLSYEEAADYFIVKVDASIADIPGEYLVTIVVKLSDYPEIA